MPVTPFILTPTLFQDKLEDKSLPRLVIPFGIDFSLVVLKTYSWPGTNFGTTASQVLFDAALASSVNRIDNIKALLFSMNFGNSATVERGQLVIEILGTNQVTIISPPVSTVVGGSASFGGIVTGVIPIMGTGASKIRFSKFADGNAVPTGLLYATVTSFKLDPFLYGGVGAVDIPGA